MLWPICVMAESESECIQCSQPTLLQVKDAASNVKSAAGSAGEKAKDLVGQGCASRSCLTVLN